MPELPEGLERWAEIARDCRADAETARKSADRIEDDRGKDKDFGLKVGEAAAYAAVAARIEGELDLYA